MDVLVTTTFNEPEFVVAADLVIITDDAVVFVSTCGNLAAIASDADSAVAESDAFDAAITV